MSIYIMSPDHIIVEKNGSEMTFNPQTGNVQVYGHHTQPQDKTYFNKVLRDYGIDKRVVFSGHKDNVIDVIPLEEVI